jgi:amino acid adenylation domain-containing protein
MSLKNIEDAYPLSPMQQGMLFHSLYAPASGVYVEQISFDVRGALEVSAFAQAWQQLVARHPVLRTAFVWENLEKPLQVVGRQVKFPWEEQDWQGVSPIEQQERLETLLHADRKRGFELSKAPLMRLILIHLTEATYYFIWSHHHLLLDGWSAALLFTEFISYYKAFCQGQNLSLERPRPYRDYIAWLQQQDLSQAEVFWREMLKGFTAPTRLWVDQVSSRLPNQEQGYDKQKIKLSVATTAALQSLARQHQLTLNTLVQGAWALLLSCYSGEEDVVFGATVSGRPSALMNAESMVGLFINTLPVRVQVAPEKFLLPWLKKLQAQQVEARQYEYSPLIEVQGWSEVARGVPLFENIVVFMKYPVDTSLQERNGNLEIRRLDSIERIERTNYPLTVWVAVLSELSLEIVYDSHRFDSATITRMLGHLQTLLEGIVANPEQRLEDLSLLTEAEQHQLLMEWNGTQTEYPHEKCIHQLFEAQVERTPDAVAVVFEDEQLTYRELNQRANQLAQRLQQLGVKPDVLVGICVERSLEMVVGLLGILKAGGAYVPLDPAYPQERLAFILEDAFVPVLLTQEKLVAALPEHKAKVVRLDADWKEIAKESARNPLSKATTEDLAYVIYTSGSTGQPKGVQIPHGALVNFLSAMRLTPGLTQEDILLSLTTLSFDIAVLELYLPLIVGARLVVVSREVAADGTCLLERLASSGATVMQATPATWRLLLVAGWQGSWSLKILCGGEALDRKLANQLLERGTELWNLYGPTETTVWSAAYKVETQESAFRRDGVVSIGRPIANTQFYILDQHRQPVPVGVPGELHIGGLGLARGYLNRPELTAEKFIPNPFNDDPASRLYKTGDLVRYRPDGTLEYLERIDHQVKIRGFRIELGEIEAVLSQHPKVRASVVMVREDEPENKRLVAYAVLQPEQVLTITELRHFLEEKLPKYMVPSAFVMLEALPLTLNGKLDRRSLPAPEALRPELEVAYVMPQNEVERAIATVWQKTLNVERIGINDNFFDLGGHSLLIVQVHSKLREVLNRDISITDMFKYPTIRALVNYLNQYQSEQSSFEEIYNQANKRLDSRKKRAEFR